MNGSLTSLDAAAFPQRAAEFYARRDHRTNLYELTTPAYTGARVLVTIEATELQSLAGQLMLTITANLLSRWCRDVVLDLAPTEVHPQLPLSGSGDLAARILHQMHDADPFGHFRLRTATEEVNLRVHIGESASDSSVSTTIISARGWYAAIRRPGQLGVSLWDQGAASLPAAAASAILGGAQVFRDALGLESLLPPFLLFDAFTASPVEQLAERQVPKVDMTFDLGKLLMVGGGSVGSAAAYFMHMFGLTAWMRIIDKDPVEVENFGRSPIFGRSTFGASKSAALAAMLGGGAVLVDPITAWWHELDAPSLRGYDIVMPLANEHGNRWAVQSGYPPLMIHSSTGNNWNVNFGRHIPGRDDCLAERFNGFEAAPALACSTGEVKAAAGKSIDASLPFLSFWAGWLVAADLVRLAVAGYPHTPNFGLYSFRRNRFAPQLYDRLPANGCMCTGQLDGFWAFHASTRHAHLSPGRPSVTTQIVTSS